MRVLLDANVVVDHFADRPPFGPDARALWTLAATGSIQIAVSATTVTTIYYLIEKLAGSAFARQAVSDLLNSSEVCPVELSILQTALQKAWPDFEDAVQEAVAEAVGIPVIVTRDAKGFVHSTRRIVDAGTLVQEATHAP